MIFFALAGLLAVGGAIYNDIAVWMRWRDK
jgi:hypothetical protein